MLDDAIVFFTRGTLIATGLRKVEDLLVGDLVETLGPQPSRWIGSRKFEGVALPLRREHRPIEIPAGALGKRVSGTGSARLRPAPHRAVLTDCSTNVGQEEVMVPAKHLIGYAGIAVEAVPEIEYFHFVLDHHVWANGALTERILAGPMALRAHRATQCYEIALIFPDNEMPKFTLTPARRIL